MKKCLYTEADITQTGSQIILHGISLDGIPRGRQDRHFKHAFPDAWNVVQSMLNSDIEDEDTDVNVGDVIWANQGGNRHIGFCIVRESSDSEINKIAVSLCMRSAAKKAKELNLEYVGMGLFGSDTSKEWANIVEEIEENLGNIQSVVCIPTNDELTDVLENLPGSHNFTMIKSN